MKFTKPISREVDINGETYIVSFDDTGIDFRLKGKRKSTRADWSSLLSVAEGEQGAGSRQSQDATGSQQSQGSSETESGAAGDDSLNLSRTATAGDLASES